MQSLMNINACNGEHTHTNSARPYDRSILLQSSYPFVRPFGTVFVSLFVCQSRYPRRSNCIDLLYLQIGNGEKLINVVLLNGERLNVRVSAGATGQELYNTISEHLGLTETIFFGLMIIKDGEHEFLDLNDKLSKLAKYAPHLWKDDAIAKLTASYIRNTLPQLHKAHSGISDAQAEIEYLKEAQKLQEYGIIFNKVSKFKKDKRSTYSLGISVRGLIVFEERGVVKSPVFRHPWQNIKRMAFHRRRFFIEAHGPPDTSKIVLYTNSYKKSRYLLKMCTSFYKFQMMMGMKLSSLREYPTDGPVKMNGVVKTDASDSTGRASPVTSEAGKSFTMEQNMQQSGPAVQLNGSTPSAQENVQYVYVSVCVSACMVSVYPVQLQKSNGSLGLNIIGGIELGGIYVKTMAHDGPAALSGKISIGDRILEINGNSLEGISRQDAVNFLRTAPQVCTLLIESCVAAPATPNGKPAVPGNYSTTAFHQPNRSQPHAGAEYQYQDPYGSPQHQAYSPAIDQMGPVDQYSEDTSVVSILAKNVLYFFGWEARTMSRSYAYSTPYGRGPGTVSMPGFHSRNQSRNQASARSSYNEYDSDYYYGTDNSSRYQSLHPDSYSYDWESENHKRFRTISTGSGRDSDVYSESGYQSQVQIPSSAYNSPIVPNINETIDNRNRKSNLLELKLYKYEEKRESVDSSFFSSATRENSFDDFSSYVESQLQITEEYPPRGQRKLSLPKDQQTLIDSAELSRLYSSDDPGLVGKFFSYLGFESTQEENQISSPMHPESVQDQVDQANVKVNDTTAEEEKPKSEKPVEMKVFKRLESEDSGNYHAGPCSGENHDTDDQRRYEYSKTLQASGILDQDDIDYGYGGQQKRPQSEQARREMYRDPKNKGRSKTFDDDYSMYDDDNVGLFGEVVEYPTEKPKMLSKTRKFSWFTSKDSEPLSERKMSVEESMAEKQRNVEAGKDKKDAKPPMNDSNTKSTNLENQQSAPKKGYFSWFSDKDPAQEQSLKTAPDNNNGAGFFGGLFSTQTTKQESSEPIQDKEMAKLSSEAPEEAQKNGVKTEAKNDTVLSNTGIPGLTLSFAEEFQMPKTPSPSLERLNDGKGAQKTAEDKLLSKEKELKEVIEKVSKAVVQENATGNEAEAVNLSDVKIRNGKTKPSPLDKRNANVTSATKSTEAKYGPSTTKRQSLKDEEQQKSINTETDKEASKSGGYFSWLSGPPKESTKPAPIVEEAEKSGLFGGLFSSSSSPSPSPSQKSNRKDSKEIVTKQEELPKPDTRRKSSSTVIEEEQSRGFFGGLFSPSQTRERDTEKQKEGQTKQPEQQLSKNIAMVDMPKVATKDAGGAQQAKASNENMEKDANLADGSFKKNFETPPKKNFETPTKKNFETPPKKNLETPPKKNFETPPEKNFETTPKKNFQTTPKKNLDEMKPSMQEGDEAKLNEESKTDEDGVFNRMVFGFKGIFRKTENTEEMNKDKRDMSQEKKIEDENEARRKQKVSRYVKEFSVQSQPSLDSSEKSGQTDSSKVAEDAVNEQEVQRKAKISKLVREFSTKEECLDFAKEIPPTKLTDQRESFVSPYKESSDPFENANTKVQGKILTEIGDGRCSKSPGNEKALFGESKKDVSFTKEKVEEVQRQQQISPKDSDAKSQETFISKKEVKVAARLDISKQSAAETSSPNRRSYTGIEATVNENKEDERRKKISRLVKAFSSHNLDSVEGALVETPLPRPKSERELQKRELISQYVKEFSSGGGMSHPPENNVNSKIVQQHQLEQNESSKEAERQKKISLLVKEFARRDGHKEPVQKKESSATDFSNQRGIEVIANKDLVEPHSTDKKKSAKEVQRQEKKARLVQECLDETTALDQKKKSQEQEICSSKQKSIVDITNEAYASLGAQNTPKEVPVPKFRFAWQREQAIFRPSSLKVDNSKGRSSDSKDANSSNDRAQKTVLPQSRDKIERSDVYKDESPNSPISPAVFENWGEKEQMLGEEEPIIIARELKESEDYHVVEEQVERNSAIFNETYDIPSWTDNEDQMNKQIEESFYAFEEVGVSGKDQLIESRHLQGNSNQKASVIPVFQKRTMSSVVDDVNVYGSKGSGQMTKEKLKSPVKIPKTGYISEVVAGQRRREAEQVLNRLPKNDVEMQNELEVASYDFAEEIEKIEKQIQALSGKKESKERQGTLENRAGQADDEKVSEGFIRTLKRKRMKINETWDGIMKEIDQDYVEIYDSSSSETVDMPTEQMEGQLEDHIIGLDTTPEYNITLGNVETNSHIDIPKYNIDENTTAEVGEQKGKDYYMDKLESRDAQGIQQHMHSENIQPNLEKPASLDESEVHVTGVADEQPGKRSAKDKQQDEEEFTDMINIFRNRFLADKTDSVSKKENVPLKSKEIQSVKVDDYKKEPNQKEVVASAKIEAKPFISNVEKKSEITSRGIGLLTDFEMEPVKEEPKGKLNSISALAQKLNPSAHTSSNDYDVKKQSSVKTTAETSQGSNEKRSTRKLDTAALQEPRKEKTSTAIDKASKSQKEHEKHIVIPKDSKEVKIPSKDNKEVKKQKDVAEASYKSKTEDNKAEDSSFATMALRMIGFSHHEETPKDSELKVTEESKNSSVKAKKTVEVKTSPRTDPVILATQSSAQSTTRQHHPKTKEEPKEGKKTTHSENVSMKTSWFSITGSPQLKKPGDEVQLKTQDKAVDVLANDSHLGKGTFGVPTATQPAVPKPIPKTSSVEETKKEKQPENTKKEEGYFAKLVSKLAESMEEQERQESSKLQQEKATATTGATTNASKSYVATSQLKPGAFGAPIEKPRSGQSQEKKVVKSQHEHEKEKKKTNNDDKKDEGYFFKLVSRLTEPVDQQELPEKEKEPIRVKESEKEIPTREIIRDEKPKPEKSATTKRTGEIKNPPKYEKEKKKTDNDDKKDEGYFFKLVSRLTEPVDQQELPEKEKEPIRVKESEKEIPTREIIRDEKPKPEKSATTKRTGEIKNPPKYEKEKKKTDNDDKKDEGYFFKLVSRLTDPVDQQELLEKEKEAERVKENQKEIPTRERIPEDKPKSATTKLNGDKEKAHQQEEKENAGLPNQGLFSRIAFTLSESIAHEEKEYLKVDATKTDKEEKKQKDSKSQEHMLKTREDQKTKETTSKQNQKMEKKSEKRVSDTAHKESNKNQEHQRGFFSSFGFNTTDSDSVEQQKIPETKTVGRPSQKSYTEQNEQKHVKPVSKGSHEPKPLAFSEKERSQISKAHIVGSQKQEEKKEGIFSKIAFGFLESSQHDEEKNGDILESRTSSVKQKDEKPIPDPQTKDKRTPDRVLTKEKAEKEKKLMTTSTNVQSKEKIQTKSPGAAPAPSMKQDEAKQGLFARLAMQLANASQEETQAQNEGKDTDEVTCCSSCIFDKADEAKQGMFARLAMQLADTSQEETQTQSKPIPDRVLANEKAEKEKKMTTTSTNLQTKEKIQTKSPGAAPAPSMKQDEAKQGLFARLAMQLADTSQEETQAQSKPIPDPQTKDKRTPDRIVTKEKVEKEKKFMTTSTNVQSKEKIQTKSPGAAPAPSMKQDEAKQGLFARLAMQLADSSQEETQAQSKPIPDPQTKDKRTPDRVLANEKAEKEKKMMTKSTNIQTKEKIQTKSPPSKQDEAKQGLFARLAMQLADTSQDETQAQKLSQERKHQTKPKQINLQKELSQERKHQTKPKHINLQKELSQERAQQNSRKQKSSARQKPKADKPAERAQPGKEAPDKTKADKPAERAQPGKEAPDKTKADKPAERAQPGKEAPDKTKADKPAERAQPGKEAPDKTKADKPAEKPPETMSEA
ncbi:hypothetical protein QZH41_013417, partial [Actinostola sp. cb2023]